jgi:hypothetical protein
VNERIPRVEAGNDSRRLARKARSQPAVDDQWSMVDTKR